MRIVIADPKTGKTYQKELEKENEILLAGKKIGDVITGEELGFAGYMLELTGGSDISGFPMRKDVSGVRKTAILLSEGVGFHPAEYGMRERKTVRGNTFSNEIQQVNMKVRQHGAQPIDQLFPAKASEEKKQ